MRANWLETFFPCEDSKLRWTYEARQEIPGWFEPTATPIGRIAPGLLVISGVHARLSNISASGHWVREEKFVFNGRLVHRRAGESAGRILEPVRKVRASHPELIAELSDVYSQPGATVDTILMSWVVEANSAKVPATFSLRDCLAASFSEDVVRSKQLSNQFEAYVFPKLTATLQVTDTDFSREFKSLCRRRMDEHRLEMQARAESSTPEGLWFVELILQRECA